MKPRAFICSSVEGLDVAYAVQQNLIHDADVTVWDQGVFDLSSMTIESLIQELQFHDFGIFIFSSTDIVRMRENASPSVRDNVLFELGLFISKLGWDRVCVVMPSGSDIHISRELIGIIPGKYEANRTDGNMQAGTRAVCHQMITHIRKLGVIEARTSLPAPSEDPRIHQAHKHPWTQDFLDENYESAKATLQNMLASQTGHDAIETQALIQFCELWIASQKANKGLRNR